MKKPESIKLCGIRQNNLKNLNVDIPIGKLTVVTGLSGTGKSSLVFDTLHAEGQRRYVETFSAYTRQFMDMLDRPDVDDIENIRPSIAIEQSNTVKTSRSTVGTMTELCDYFKVWFTHHANLYDPQTGKLVEDDNPISIWKKAFNYRQEETILLCFQVNIPEKLETEQVIKSLSSQGYSRTIYKDKVIKLDELQPKGIDRKSPLFIIQDRIQLLEENRNRFLDATRTALEFGHGHIHLYSQNGELLSSFSEGLHSPESNKTFKPAIPNLFSFNSPIGACPKCRGFGRIIQIDYRLVIPDENLTLEEGAIRAFQGEVYQESLKDLIRGCKKYGIRYKVPYKDLTEEEKAFVMDGNPDFQPNTADGEYDWYGLHRFFDWLESNTYKMHVRVFLSKYRSYVTCPQCLGDRLQPEALNWKWRGYTLPDLYKLPIKELLEKIQKTISQQNNEEANLAYKAIITRLNFLKSVGLGYLTLDRTSKTLSGGEVERVNLTASLGTGLVDTLFVLDEPSVGLHARDIHRLVNILKRLTSLGNTVVVVEHDETIMRAADNLIEVGPTPGKDGGEIVAQGNLQSFLLNPNSITGAYLNNSLPENDIIHRRSIDEKTKRISIYKASKHNIANLSVEIPLERFVVLSGVSGSGKSTLLNNIIYQGFCAERGNTVEDIASYEALKSDMSFDDIVLVDQSPISRTPRSNAALFTKAWNHIRNLFEKTEAAQSAGYRATDFSFNSGNGRCECCKGLGYEKVEMQFMADVYTKCTVCEGKRFKPEILEIRYDGKSIGEILELTVDEALEFFKSQRKVYSSLEVLSEVGLGYLPLGQPLNTLSGGESQRLKLVKYLSKMEKDVDSSLILLDEPTTGLHRHDVRRLLTVLQKLVHLGNSLIVIEHHMDVLKAADWIIEIGPDAGKEGGKLVFEGTPEKLSQSNTETAQFLYNELFPHRALLVAEPASTFETAPPKAIEVKGAREHNLKNVSININHGQTTVITGVSGSGKSTLAFDIIFAEGQRRFMESMSPWARQFVEQLPRPELDKIFGIPPSVAIEQRGSYGTRKSTVATITEVAQYLRLLYSRIGIQHSVVSGKPLMSLSQKELHSSFDKYCHKLPKGTFYLMSSLVRSRKGHHQPLVDWAEKQGFKLLRIDRSYVPIEQFKKLDRYSLHDIEVAIAELKVSDQGIHIKSLSSEKNDLLKLFNRALKTGKGACFISNTKSNILSWFSTNSTDPESGEAYPQLDPNHFSWNSPKGWCPCCHGYGQLYIWMQKDETYTELPNKFEDEQVCPTCGGTKLNPISNAVKLHTETKEFSLPDLLKLTPETLLKTLETVKSDTKGMAVIKEVIPEIRERLRFMNEVGLGYLSLDRATITLSGGEVQRIRLAAQLGSNLSGVLYVLDEPSIGLHSRDNERLLQSLERLKKKGNTLLIVEHDEDTMLAADRIIDLGPGAGRFGGTIIADGSSKEILQMEHSITGKILKRGIPHPYNETYRKPAPSWTARSRRKDWLVIRNANLRNLKGFDAHIAINRLNVVCGISGAGKSTLIRDLLKPAATKALTENIRKFNGKDYSRNKDGSLQFKDLFNADSFKSIIEVDQSPIGRTPRSTPATYIGVFDIIRQFFGNLPEAKLMGFNSSSFSFNTKGGRCEKCAGAGRIKMEMSFMPDTYLPCDECDGKRFQGDILDVRWKGKNIADILDMSFEEAAAFFETHHRLSEMMNLMVETGLGYLRLGQSSTTLSGGEAQRMKLVSELVKGLQSYKDKSRGIKPQNLYLLEEPTIGLHFSDCELLIKLLHRMVDEGHTIVVIEHNPDIIAEADHVIELGPEGGEKGGELIYQGQLEGLLKCEKSPTAHYIKSKVMTIDSAKNESQN